MLNTDVNRIMRQYNIPEGVLTPQELRLLHEGGIRDSDSEHHNSSDYAYERTRNRPLTSNHVQLETLKSVHQNQISMKDKQIDFLKAELARKDQLLQIQRQKIRSEMQIEQDKLMTELRQARARVIQSEGQIPLIKQALGQVRDMLAGQIPESVYLRLRDLPERDLPPSEWLLVNVWQICYPYKKQTDYQKKEISKLREQVKIANDKQQSLLMQLEHYSRMLTSKDDDEKRHLLNFENNRKSMELQLEKCREQIEILREKGARYDELLRDYNFTKQEKQLIEEKMGFYSKNTDAPANTRIAEDSQSRKIDLLQQDKQYLTKENIQLLQKNKRLEDRLDRLEAELLNEKNRSQEYLHQLLNLKTDSVASYEQRIYKEISELKEKHGHELQTTKNNLIDIYEKQLRFLKETMEDKELRLDAVERELREKTKEAEQLSVDNRMFQRKMDSEQAELRVSLRIKTQELDRQSNIYQETLASLKANKLENEMLRQKVNVLKGEYYKAQASAKDSLSGLKAQVAVLQEQLANYELIEKQIDEAVVGLSSLKPNDNNIYLNTLNSVPTSNKRRIQQALGLAQRLQAKQRQFQELSAKLLESQETVSQLRDQLRVAKELLDKSNQPYSYLVSTIQEKEKEILMLRNANRKKEQDYQNIKEECMLLQKQLEEAENDLKRLLVKRQHIHNIQSLLANLASGSASKAEINSAIQQMQDMLGGTRSGGGVMKTSAGVSRGKQEQLPLWYRKLAEKKGKN